MGGIILGGAIAVMLVGLVCTLRMRREDFPSFELEVILITVPYPGATPEESVAPPPHGS